MNVGKIEQLTTEGKPVIGLDREPDLLVHPSKKIEEAEQMLPIQSVRDSVLKMIANSVDGIKEEVLETGLSLESLKAWNELLMEVACDINVIFYEEDCITDCKPDELMVLNRIREMAAACVWCLEEYVNSKLEENN
ncbi:MAG: hypothetical protein RLN90_09655 [Balneolaceae bacterium]